MKKLYIYIGIILCLIGCRTSNEIECPEVIPQETCKKEEIIKDEAYYQTIMSEYYYNKLTGTWVIDEHQTITFNGDGTGTIIDDGSGRLDGKAGTYDVTYELLSYNRLTMRFSMNFECKLGATAIYEITFVDDAMFLASRGGKYPIYDEIMIIKQ